MMQKSMQEKAYDIIYKIELGHWWYRVRRAIVHNLLTFFTIDRKHPLRILDIGCGMGALLKEMEEFGEVEGVDISPRAIAYCKERGFSAVSVGSADALPYANDTFDVVVILDVLEHLKDDIKGAQEVARVLKAGGVAIIAVPAFMFLWGITDELSQHYRRYTRKEIVQCIQTSGLSVWRATYFNTFLFPAIASVRLFVRLFRIQIKSENSLEGNITNRLFYFVFYIESIVMRWVNFPFGVSILVVAKKDTLSSK